MSDEQMSHTNALMESMQKDMRVMAEAQTRMVERLDQMEPQVAKTGADVEVLKLLAIDAQRRLEKLEGFATDAGPRLQRVEDVGRDSQQRLQRIETRVDALDAFATDAGPRLQRVEEIGRDSQQRLKRIETHLRLKSSTSTRAARPSRARSAKRHKKN
jgi:chromosome segregation ATPase